MIAGILILIALGNNPPSAGAFCLNTYYQLEPVDEVISSYNGRSPVRWNSVEVCYSDNRAPSLEESPSQTDLSSTSESNYHFVICNGHIGSDGQIQSTERWRKQQLVTVDQDSRRTARTIRICVMGNSRNTPPTNFQIKRLDALIEGLCRRFDIRRESIYYPEDWR